MTSVEASLLTELRNLEAAVQNLKTSQPKPDLMSHFQRIEALTAELPRGTEPDLLHYLHKKSYEKARLWLEGRDAENVRGRCGH